MVFDAKCQGKDFSMVIHGHWPVKLVNPPASNPLPRIHALPPTPSCGADGHFANNAKLLGNFSIILGLGSRQIKAARPATIYYRCACDKARKVNTPMKRIRAAIKTFPPRNDR